MRRIPVLAALLLASCVARPAPGTSSGYYLGMPPTYDVQPQPTLSRAPAAGKSVEYAGHGDGSLLAVRLTSLPGGHMQAEGTSQGDGTACGGAFTGTGTLRGNRLVVLDKSAPTCPITLTRAGRKLTVDADSGRNCSMLHGAQCSLSGQLTQR